MNALVNTRHRDQHRGANGFQVIGQQSHRSCKGHATARRDGKVVAPRALESVRQREKRQKNVVLGGRNAFEHGLHITDHVAVRQHHALGLAGGARGIDDGGEVFRSGRRGSWRGQRLPCTAQPLRERAQGRAVGTGRMGLQGRVFVRHHHSAQRGKRCSHIADVFPLRDLVDNQHRGFAVLQDVGNAARVVDSMQRNGYPTRRQGGLVGTDGVQPVGQQNGHACAVGQLHGDEGLRPLRHPFCHLRPAQVKPGLGSGVKKAVGRCVGGQRCPMGKKLGKGLRGGDVCVDRGHLGAVWGRAGGTGMGANARENP